MNITIKIVNLYYAQYNINSINYQYCTFTACFVWKTDISNILNMHTENVKTYITDECDKLVWGGVNFGLRKSFKDETHM